MVRPLGNTNTPSSGRKYISPPNGSTPHQTVASRRLTAGFDLDDDENERSTYNGLTSSDDETTGGVSALFVDEQDDQLDKENR